MGLKVGPLGKGRVRLVPPAAENIIQNAPLGYVLASGNSATSLDDQMNPPKVGSFCTLTFSQTVGRCLRCSRVPFNVSCLFIYFRGITLLPIQWSKCIKRLQTELIYKKDILSSTLFILGRHNEAICLFSLASSISSYVCNHNLRHL